MPFQEKRWGGSEILVVPPETLSVTADWSSTKPEINKDTFLVKFQDKSVVDCTNIEPQYSWEFSNGKTSTEKNPEIFFKYDQTNLNATPYSASLTVTCAGAAETKSDTLPGNITLTQEDLERASTASIGMGEVKGNKDGFSLQFTNTSETVCLDENISYLWDFGDGTTSTELAPAHNYTAAPYGQTFNVSLKVSCGGTEIANNTFPLTINGNEEQFYHIASNFSNTPSSVTLDTVGITYTDSSEIMCMTAEPSYFWKSNGAGTSNEPNPVFTYNFKYAEGNDFSDVVSLTVTCGSVKNTVIKNVSATLKEIRPLVPLTKITADWEYSKPEINKDTFLIKFTNKSTISCNEFTPVYNWSFGDGTFSDEASPTHSYAYNPMDISPATPITKNVSLEITCSGNLPEDTASLNIKTGDISLTSADLAKASIADFILKDVAGNKTSFTATFENKSTTVCTASNTSYYWDFGDGVTSTAFEPSHTYTNFTYPASYTVKMNVLCGGSETDTPKTAKVNVSANNASFFKIKPQWSYNLASIAASTFRINFINSSSVQCLGTEPRYSWNFGDGTFSTDANPIHDFAFTPPLNFSDNISLTIFCGSKTEKLVKEVKATANEESYSITPSFTYAPGTIDNKTVSVSFTDTSSVSCPGTVPTYKWVFGDGSESISQNPVHKYAYTKPLNLSQKATLTVKCDSKSAQKEETVRITPDPLTFIMTADWTSAQTGVNESGAVISFTNTSTAVCPGVEPTYEWDFGGTLGKSNLKNPQQTFTKEQLASSPSISLVVKCAGAPDSAPKTAQISGGQFIKTNWSYQMTSVDYTAPIQGHVNFIDASQITCDTAPTYKWNFGDGSPEQNISATSIQHTYSVTSLPASYLATLTVVCGSFSLKKVSNIVINDVKISGGEYHTFTAVNGSTYVWGANDYGQIALSSVNGNSRQTIPTKPGFFTDKTIIATKGGYDYSALLSNDGKVYTFGKGNSGQLGYSSAASGNSTPVQVTEGGAWLQICYHHLRRL